MCRTESLVLRSSAVAAASAYWPPEPMAAIILSPTVWRFRARVVFLVAGLDILCSFIHCA
jgi:hypothetical protein